MNELNGNPWFYVASALGSLVYVLMKPDPKWYHNLIKFVIGFVCSFFTSGLVLSVFRWFFGFSPEAYDTYLPPTGFVTGVLAMTFYEAVVRWMNSDLGTLLSEVIGSWLKKK